MFFTLCLIGTSFILGYTVRELPHLRELYTVVTSMSIKHPLLETFRIVADVVAVSAEQMIRRTVIPHDNGTYTLQYVIAGKLHSFNVYPEVGPYMLLKSPNTRGEISLRRYRHKKPPLSAD